jgi:VanZ family protein
MREFLKANYPGILWGLGIFVLTGIPGSFLPVIPTFLTLFEPDKLVHIFIFAVYVFLSIRGFRKTPQMFFHNNPVLLAINFGVFFGGATELMQGWFIPNRVASIYDFIANLAGCFLGWGLFVYFEKRSTTKNAKGATKSHKD